VLAPKDFYEALQAADIRFYAGVPDSLLKDFCAYVTDHAPRERNVITANEGGAIALAMGYHLATSEIGLVYMQNSGLGNTVNPLTSLADPAIYGVPMLLVVGWRGEPDKKDEPQHVQMGKVTLETLAAIGVPSTVLPDDLEGAKKAIAAAVKDMRARNAPHALVVKKGTFEPYKLSKEKPAPYEMARETAIQKFVETVPAGSLIVSTTGMPSRELFETRAARKEPHQSDLLIVGGMGHASQIALGVALEQPKRRVYCLDGDGAMLMHLGGLSTIGTLAPKNYRHVVLNNGAHDSVGGQPTVAFEVDLCAVAKACGYRDTRCVVNEAELSEGLTKLHGSEGPVLLEVRVRKGNRKELGRPTMTPAELKRDFMAYAQGQAK